MSDQARMIVYMTGTFYEQPAARWYLEALRLEDEGLDWYAALSRALGTELQRFGPDPLGDIGPEIFVWRTLGGGGYVETGSTIDFCGAVWVPSQADWWPFQTSYLLPLASVVGRITVADNLARIGNALIAYGRYGAGHHIDRYSGCSRIDEHQDEQQRRAHRKPGGA